ncbi:MAG: family 10 glycosylhydrolase [Ignavibacteriae bacterium]|nr:family 10 glycosylhydrolase [Ignavibacteriota bacterium]
MTTSNNFSKSSFFFLFVLFSCLILIRNTVSSQAQTQAIPKTEVRAIWLTTVLGLDWPPSKIKKADEQKRLLSEMIEKAAKAKFNTMYFQVRGRADAMYKSDLEPWSHLLTGELGKDPGWDPLQFVVEESHKRGVEVHAWFNTFLTKSGKEKPTESKPRHLILAHPEWLQLVKGEWWLDPGIPEARKYISHVAMDIVRRYNIDGFQFDFMRYPQNGIPDDATWKKYGGNQPKAEWRRENINKFVRDFYDSAMLIKPMLKVGATPIGIYNADVYKNGMKGFDDVFQDAKGWLREGKLDYIAPQVYWSLKDTSKGPDFAMITEDWVDGSNDRQIIVGIAAYKDDVFSQLPTIIDTSRDIETDGHAFFRYEHIRRVIDSTDVYTTLANIPPMKWKDSVPPSPPLALNVERKQNIATVSWTSPLAKESEDTVKFYNIYRSKVFPVDISDANLLYRIVQSNITSFTDTLPNSSAHFHYAVSSLDYGNNESHPVQEGIMQVPEVLAILNRFQYQPKLHRLIYNEDFETVTLPLQLTEKATLKISIVEISSNSQIATIEKEVTGGRNLLTIDVAGFGKREYLFKVESLNFTAQQQILLQ